jgi:methanogenic corrinoid protein MtbC1
MVLWCAYCQKVLGEKEPFENHSITHGICPKCRAEKAVFNGQLIDRSLAIKKFLEDVLSLINLKKPFYHKEFIDKCLKLGLGPKEIIFFIIQPFMIKIGEDWAIGELEVAEEHAYSVEVEKVLNYLLEMCDSSMESHQPVDALVMPASLSEHFFGCKVVSIMLQLEGLRVINFFNGATFKMVKEAIDTYAPKAIVVSCTLEVHVNEVFKLDTQLTKENYHIPLFVGGQGFSNKVEPLSHHIQIIKNFDDLIQKIHPKVAS